MQMKSFKGQLLGGISALALTAAAPMVAHAQSVTGVFESGTSTTALNLEGAYGIGDISAIASQVNPIAVITANTGTEGGSLTSSVTVTNVGGGTGTVPTVGDEVTVPGAGSGAVSLLASLGATTGSTAQVVDNAVGAAATGNRAARELNLDLVTSALPSAVLGLNQANSGVTATAQIGAPATALVEGTPVYTGTGDYAGVNATEANYDDLVRRAGAADDIILSGSITRTVTTTGGASGTLIGITGTTAENATAIVSGNAVEAAVLFNTAAQTASGAARSVDTGASASVTVTANLPPAEAPFAVTANAPVVVATSQTNSGLNTDPLATWPAASVYNTRIGTVLSGAATGNNTVETSSNAVAATLAGNVSANTIQLDGDASASFNGGLASATVQSNRASGALGTLVIGTDIGILIGEDTPAGFDGTAMVFGNTVDSTATGNSARTSIANTLATALVGNFVRDAANVSISALSGSAAGDVVATTQQDNVNIQLLSVTDATQVAIAADSIIGLAAVENNAVRAGATLNTATSAVTALRGDGVTTASVITQSNLGGAAQAAVSATEILAETIRTDSGTTVSVVGNQVGSAVTFNRAAQTATVATTQADVESEAANASVTLVAPGALSVAAQVSLTTLQVNAAPPVSGSGVNTSLPLDQAAALTSGTEIYANLAAGTAPSPVAMTTSVGGNAVTASVMGNESTNRLTFGGSALSDVAGVSVFSGQNNAAPGDMTAAVANTVIGIDVVGGYLGAALVDQNTVASSSVGNRSVNAIANSLSTALQGSFVAAPTSTTAALNGSDTVFSAIGDYVVGNLQNNTGTAVDAITGGTDIGVRVSGGLSAGTTGSVSANQVLATATLNETVNGLTLVGGSGIVGTLANFQGNAAAGAVESAAVASVSDTRIALNASAPAVTSTLLVDGNTVRAAASGNLATNTVANGGLTTGRVITGQGSATVEAETGPTTVVRADYAIANRQQNVGTSLQSSFRVSAEVLNTDLAISGALTGSVAQMAGNTVLASAMGNQATNRMAMTGNVSATLAEMSLQENRFASVTASVQGARLTVTSPTTGSSTALAAGNVVGASATGNMLTSIIGR